MNYIKSKAKKILIQSQKHTKADMLYIARGSFWVGLNQTASGILSFSLLIAFANLLPKETYGGYRYILSIAGMLNILTLTGMNSAVSRTVAVGNEGILKPAVVYQFKWNSMMFVGFLVLSGYYLFQNDHMLAIAFLILGFFTPLTLAFNTYGAYLEGKRKLRDANILAILATLVYSLGTLIALLLTDEVTWLIAVYGVTTFIPSVAFYIFVMSKYKPDTNTDVASTFKHARELTYIRFLEPIVSQIDKIILGSFWGAGQLATYSLAMAIPGRAVPALKRFINIGFPKFSTKTHEELNSVFYRRIFSGMCIGVFFTLGYIIAAPFVFKYLLPQYIEGVFYSQILAISFIFAMPTRYIGLLFESQKMSVQILTNTIINSSLAIALYITLGIWGGVMGLVIGYVLWSFLGMLVNLISWKMSSKRKATVV